MTLKSSRNRTIQQQKSHNPNSGSIVAGGGNHGTSATLDGNVAVRGITHKDTISDSSLAQEQWLSTDYAESHVHPQTSRMAIARNAGGSPADREVPSIESSISGEPLLRQQSFTIKRSFVYGSFALTGVILLSTLAICSITTSLTLEYVAELNLLTAGSAILLPTILLAGSRIRSSLRAGNIWSCNTLIALASLTSVSVALVSLFTDSHGLGFTVLMTAIISNASLWVREFITEGAPSALQPVPESLQSPKGLLRELLTPTEEERFFTERSCQLILLASFLCVTVMMARGTPALEALSVGSFILLLLPLPLVVEVVPAIRAFVCRSLQNYGVFVEHSETIDAIEGVSTLLVEIPDQRLCTPPAPEKGIWEFDRLDIFDGRFDETNLKGIIAALCSRGRSRFAREVTRAFSNFATHHRNPTGSFRCQDFTEIDSTTITGTVEGVPLLIGKEGIFIQNGIFLSGHEVVVPSTLEEGDSHSQAHPTSPHKVVVLLVGVGHACVARLVLKLRWDYRGLEVARELDRKNLIHTSVISTGAQHALDTVCSALHIDLASAHGAVSEYKIQQRVIENDPAVAAFVNPERFSSTAETLNATVKIVSVLEAREEFDLDMQLRNVRNVVRLATPSMNAISALFEIPRKALLLRQVLLVSSVGLTALLYILLLFALCSPLICGTILCTYLAIVALMVSIITKDRPEMYKNSLK